MKDIKEIQAEFDISRIQAKAAKESASYKFISEIAEALGIKVQKSEKTALATQFYFIEENGLGIFTSDHKVAIVYQPENGDAVTHYMTPNKDLKLAILSAYKDARLEVQKRKESEENSDYVQSAVA
ncbi:hypothetical protein [Aeromonas salmonicida]